MTTSGSHFKRSAEPLRRLSATDLDIGASLAMHSHSSNRPDDPPLADDHPLLLEVRELLSRFGGVIFSGPPGTSKSYFAAKVGTKLADDDESRIRFVQFHPSFQYEDFMEGFVPNQLGTGFVMVPKHFVAMSRQASEPDNRDKTFVLVVDELSRGDPGRIFGEALTYVERSKRGLTFQLASGDSLSVPDNLAILATMNPLDRGVDEVDAAFERRFARIAMEPDAEILRSMLSANDVVPAMQEKIISFFNMINGRARSIPQAAVGHTFFSDVHDHTTLHSVWDHQLKFLVAKAFRLDQETRRAVEIEWERLFEPDPGTDLFGASVSDSTTPDDRRD